MAGIKSPKLPKLTAIGKIMSQAEREAAKDLARMSPSVAKELEKQEAQALYNQLDQVPPGSPMNPASESAEVFSKNPPQAPAAEASEAFDSDYRPNFTMKEAPKAPNDFAMDDVTKEINPSENEEWVNFMKRNKSTPDPETGIVPYKQQAKAPDEILPPSKIEAPKSEPLTVDTAKALKMDIDESKLDDAIKNLRPDLYTKFKALPNSQKMAVAASLGFLGYKGTQMMNSGGEQEQAKSPAKPVVAPKKEEQPDPVKDLSEEEKSVKEELAQLKAEDSAPKTSKSFVNEMLKAEGTSLGSDANLKEAQSKRDQEHAANTFGRAADTLSGALLHTGNKLDKFYSEQDEFANRHVSDIKDRIANEKNDPGSAVSDAYRKILGEFGVKIEGPISAAAVEKIAPWVEKKYLAEEARKARIEELKIRQQELKANKEVAKQEKQVKINSDKTAAYRKEIDKNTKPLQDTYDNRDQIVKFLEEAIKNPVGGGFQDAAITYGFIKSRDNSAVREGEMKMLAAAGSVPDRLRREFSKAMSGQAYNSQDMKDLIAVIRNENAKLKNSYSNRVKSVLKQAEKEGLDLTEVNPRNDMYSPLVNQEQLNQEAPESKFTQGQEAGIARVMQNNKISREEAIKALKQAGKL